ncbi:hypothetical protein HAX54_000716 [Datura stramonium]|uniref:Peptidase A1 domain-containing protein n=1 Tax=Datura stramonium TaxID=4076 RepID=A0ABS8WU56_DATST|nr:hypothetical protein [Datura stramonium]
MTCEKIVLYSFRLTALGKKEFEGHIANFFISGQSSCPSIVLPLYGNVYPIGYYYVQLNIGQPSRPFFLDPDTGSDLTWLQCDAPCVRCTRRRLQALRRQDI